MVGIIIPAYSQERDRADIQTLACLVPKPRPSNSHSDNGKVFVNYLVLLFLIKFRDVLNKAFKRLISFKPH